MKDQPSRIAATVLTIFAVVTSIPWVIGMNVKLFKRQFARKKRWP